MKEGLVTWSDIQTYWECPRKWSYRAAGWVNIESQLEAPLLRGSLIHQAVESYWQGDGIESGLAAGTRAALELAAKTRHEFGVLADEIAKLTKDAKSVAQRYVAKYGDRMVPLRSETLLALGKCGGTPDLVAQVDGLGLVLIDLKTSSNNLHWNSLDHSGQLDYYAYLWNQPGAKPLDAVCYDAATPEYITRVSRKPRPAQGRYIYETGLGIQLLAGQQAHMNPHFRWTCGQCPYFKACKAFEHSGAEVEAEVLAAEYIKEEASNV